jgi:Phosphoenolpyruvate phosphomutase
MLRLRDVLNARPRDRVISAPGVYDMVSLRMAASMGFDALYMTGYGTVASHLGLPDAGLASYAEMIERVEVMAQAAGAPLIADGDTGYGGLLNVRHTVRGYERAGAAAIQLEDQEFPKKCGHTPDRRVIPAEDMVPRSRSRSKRERALIFSSSPAPTREPRSVSPRRCAVRGSTPRRAPISCLSSRRKPKRRWPRSAASSATCRSSPIWSRADARRC